MPVSPVSGRPLAAIVMAAGEGTRMKSSRPKPLHRLCGRPMVLHVLDAARELGLERAVVVVGHGAERVTKALLEEAPMGMPLEFVTQHVQRGTGDAVSRRGASKPVQRRAVARRQCLRVRRNSEDQLAVRAL